MKSVCDALATLIRESGMSVRAVAKIANAPESTLRKLLNGETEDPRISTIDAICRACGTSMERFFARWAAQKNAQACQERASKCAPCALGGAKCAENDAACAPNDAPAVSASHKVYTTSRLFPDENGDEALLMCHSIANTGHSFHGDMEPMQMRHALEENAEAEVHAAEEWLKKAIAARDKLKGGE